MEWDVNTIASLDAVNVVTTSYIQEEPGKSTLNQEKAMTEIDMCCGTTADKALLREELSALKTQLEEAEKAAFCLDLLELLTINSDVVITADSYGSLFLYSADTVYGPKKSLQSLIQSTAVPKNPVLDNLEK